MAQTIEHLPSKHEAPSSNPRVAKKKKMIAINVVLLMLNKNGHKTIYRVKSDKN
jgi:hypothetical protein